MQDLDFRVLKSLLFVSNNYNLILTM